jgi:hypothetical protein
MGVKAVAVTCGVHAGGKSVESPQVTRSAERGRLTGVFPDAILTALMTPSCWSGSLGPNRLAFRQGVRRPFGNSPLLPEP